MVGITSFEKLLRHIIEHNRSAVAVHDTDLRYIFVSQRYLDDYNVKDKNIIGKHHYEVFPDLPQKWHDVHQRALRGEVISAENDLFIRENGQEVWTRWECRPWYHADESIGGIIIYTEVITERKQMENELRAAKDRAEKSDRLKSAFLQNMSHEIRTPLNGIMGFSQLLSEETDMNPQIRNNYCKIIYESGQRLLNVVDDVLRLSSLDSGSEQIQYELINLREFFQSLEMTFRYQIDKEKVKYINQFSEDLLVSTDPQKIYQIFTNLIQNAIKFTPQGSIEVGCNLQSKGIRFFVKDSGIGIKRENLEAIFERFYQVESGANRKYGGTGLGLSIAKGYVELLNGKIWCESEYVTGTTFQFDLPLEIKSGFELQKEEQAIVGAQEGKQLHFLIAEDEFTNFFFLNVLLQKKHFLVTRVTNGQEAVEACLPNNDFDIVLMDIKMPVMDGIEATRLIKRAKPDQFIIAQTAYTQKEQQKIIQEAGFDAYLEKPIDPIKLFDLIRKYTTESLV